MQNSKNEITGDSVSLNRFFDALDSLRAGTRKTVSIVHIGDSHIQADYFSGMVRVLLQQKFGNAGRGLVFPYKIAHTNEPVNYTSSSADEWIGIRNVINPNQVDIGISGVSLFSKTDHTSFTVKLKNQKNLNYSFNHVDLFSNQSQSKNTQVTFNDDGGIITAEQKFIPYITTFNLKDTTNTVNLKFSEHVDIHGLVFRNDSTGIIYHAIGVNGATFKSYNTTSLFLQQLEYLKPDLIIISLGTNESYANKFNITDFSNESIQFIENIKVACNACSILLTTPADNYKIKKGKAVHNAKPKIIGQYLKEYAQANHYALWDLYEAMGGEHSMKQWKKQNLAVKDYVHFTRKGYELQGSMLFDALMKKYSKK